jgi:hypothetical protein
MNGAFVHLAVNHIPVVGVPMAFLLLLAGAGRKSRDLLQAGYVTLAVLALLTIVVFKSGGPAAQVVRGMTGVTRESIHAHAEAADDVFGATEVLGAAALLCLWLLGRPKGIPNALAGLMLAGALGVSVWLGYVAHLGGLIRHPEIEAGVQAPPVNKTPSGGQADED